MDPKSQELKNDDNKQEGESPNNISDTEDDDYDYPDNMTTFEKLVALETLKWVIEVIQAEMKDIKRNYLPNSNELKNDENKQEDIPPNNINETEDDAEKDSDSDNSVDQIITVEELRKMRNDVAKSLAIAVVCRNLCSHYSQVLKNNDNKQEDEPPNNVSDRESDGEMDLEIDDNDRGNPVTLEQIKELSQEMMDINAEVIHITRNYLPNAHELKNNDNKQENEPPNNLDDTEDDAEMDLEFGDNDEGNLATLKQMEELRQEVAEMKNKVIHIRQSCLTVLNELKNDDNKQENKPPNNMDDTEDDAEMDLELADNNRGNLATVEELEKLKQEVANVKADVIHVRRNYVPMLQYMNSHNAQNIISKNAFATLFPGMSSGNK